jgi:hypothetical protein
MVSSKSYDYSWAAQRYKEFCNSYPRATGLLQQIFGYQDYEPVRALCSDQKRWENYKKRVKRLERSMNRLYGKEWPSFHEIPTQLLRDLKDDIRNYDLFWDK